MLKEVMVTQHKNKKIGPSQREAGIKHVLELFIFKTEDKLFWEVNVLCQRMVTDENSIPFIKQTFKSSSHKGRYFYQQGRSSIFSLFYTCRYFTGCHCLSDKSGQKCEENLSG